MTSHRLSAKCRLLACGIGIRLTLLFFQMTESAALEPTANFTLLPGAALATVLGFRRNDLEGLVLYVLGNAAFLADFFSACSNSLSGLCGPRILLHSSSKTTKKSLKKWSGSTATATLVLRRKSRSAVTRPEAEPGVKSRTERGRKAKSRSLAVKRFGMTT